jgi:hypothetical protein
MVQPARVPSLGKWGDRTVSDSENGSLVLALCSRSGNILRPWAEAGHECIAADLENDQRTEEIGDGSIRYVQADVRDYRPPAGDYAAAFAFPPCTDMAVSGARWMQEKGLHALAGAIETVAECHGIISALDCPWMLENPVSTLATYWRDPDWKFDPFQYDGYTDCDEAYTKETWLWTGGGFRMPVTNGPETGDDRIHRMPPSDDRSEVRAETPTGFARAVYLAHQNPAEYARADADGTEQADLTEVAP